MPEYAEAFSPVTGRCFRFAHSGRGHATHCSHPVAGPLRVDKRHEVDLTYIRYHRQLFAS